MATDNLTVTRVAKEQREVQPHPQPGRVEVTIDDVRALLEMMNSMLPNSPAAVVYLDGGSFDRPEDLRELTDAELRTLRVVKDTASSA